VRDIFWQESEKYFNSNVERKERKKDRKIWNCIKIL